MIINFTDTNILNVYFCLTNLKDHSMIQLILYQLFKFHFICLFISPTPLQKIFVSSALYVNTPSAKMSMLPVIPYKRYLI